jgi:release factor glutamine methyltransferase
LTLAEVLAEARQSIPPAEARLLLGHVLARSAAWLEAHREESLSTEQLAQFRGLVARRAAGEPVAYLLGSREFYGRDFMVTPAVLIPRPETELLVEVVLGKVGAGGTARVLDLGTGSGCVAVTMALELPQADVSAVDISPAALSVANSNALRLNAMVNFFEGDWYSALPPARFDLIVANPPYVAADDRHLAEGDLRFEPTQALTDQADGLAALRRIIADAPRWLADGGWLFSEHGYDQGDAVSDLLCAAGFVDIEQYCDLAGIVRVSGGRRGDVRTIESACI